MSELGVIGLMDDPRHIWRKLEVGDSLYYWDNDGAGWVERTRTETGWEDWPVDGPAEPSRHYTIEADTISDAIASAIEAETVPLESYDRYVYIDVCIEELCFDGTGSDLETAEIVLAPPEPVCVEHRSHSWQQRAAGESVVLERCERCGHYRRTDSCAYRPDGEPAPGPEVTYTPAQPGPRV